MNSVSWKGIVLAGGAGTRLHPITRVSSKQMLPVYDKPMIYYPVSTLMLGGIRDILIISTPRDLPQFKELLGDGSHLGIQFSYAEQAAPNGIAEAFILGADFIGESPVCLILGDNLFYGPMDFFRKALSRPTGATVFGYRVHDPERYGVVEFSPDGTVLSIEEKPEHPKSSYAIPGLYCYDNQVVVISQKLKASPRGELEITDVNKTYLARQALRVELLGRGMAWLDTGTPQSLLEAGSFVASIENRQGQKIGCLEEIAFRMGMIDLGQLLTRAAEYKGNPYGAYLENIAREVKELSGFASN
jgi:glucose-1-phosphate thymidylyltransferase